MNCDRLTYEYLPYEIHVLFPDNFGKWPEHGRLHSKHNTAKERDEAFDLLTETKTRRYVKAVNEYEYDAMIAAEYRYERARLQKAAKADDTDVAGAFKESQGIDPATNYVCWREL